MSSDIHLVWIVAAACTMGVPIEPSAAGTITPTDAISREFTVYVDNLTEPPMTDAVSREFTVYIGNQPLRDQIDAVTREFTVFIGALNVPINDAISREFTVYVGNQPLRDQTDAVTREFTVFIGELNIPINDAVSREMTVYVGTQPLQTTTDAVTREFTVFVGELPSFVLDAVTDGCRSIRVTVPFESENPFAVRVTSPDFPCLDQFVGPDGFLVEDAVLQFVEDWGELHVRGEDVVPEATYELKVDFGIGNLPGSAGAVTWAWGDVNGNQVANFADIQLTIQAFQRNYANVTPYAADLWPCLPNETVNFSDIQQTVLAFQGVDFADTSCGLPCF